MSASLKRVLVYGGRGALGATVVDLFKKSNWFVLSVDLVKNESADANVVVPGADGGPVATSWVDQAAFVCENVDAALKGSKLDAILCLAGGWAGGNAGSSEFIKNADLMWKQSVWSSMIAAEIAAKHLTNDGLLQLTGAAPALGPTSYCIGYGIAKAAVHQLVASLADSKGGLPSNASVLAILPVTLDTPMNRKSMPKADVSTWTPLEFVAKKLLEWSNKNDVPKRGSLVKFQTSDGNTVLSVVGDGNL